MTTQRTATDAAVARASAPRGLHPAWIVAAVTLGALVAASAFRSSTGVLIEPIEESFGWSRATTSGAVSLNLVIYGLTAPFAAALMERWGVRRIVTGSLVLVGVASALTTVMNAPWQLWALWGLVIGVGTGSMALVFGAIVANRWFETHRGLVTGIFSAASATGQLLFLPAIAWTATHHGWRAAALIVSVLAAIMGVLTLLFLHDRPQDRGLLPFGATDEMYAAVAASSAPAATPREGTNAPGSATSMPPARTEHHELDACADLASDTPLPPALAPSATASPVRLALTTLTASSRTWVFWALVLSLAVCGWSTNGLIQTHFVPAAHDHGMPATTAAWLLATVGIFDVVGTVASGWLTDKVNARWLLAIYYGGRGASLLAIDHVLAPGIEPGMWVFIVFYGLDWVATVPPTVALCRQHFGLERSGVVFGWVFASHMVGAGIGASVAGWLRTAYGSYHWAWLIAAGLCLASTAVVLTIRRPARR